MVTKNALILSGGGMTCAYSAGALIALADKYNYTSPDIVIGSSGGAGTAAYFVAGQYESIRNIWKNLLCTKKFINPLRFWKIIDIDFLIDTIFKKEDPLSEPQVYNSAINFYIPYTNTNNGFVEYYYNKSGSDIFEALRATKAMPLVYRKSIKINNSCFCDTYVSSSIPLNIEKAKNLGAEKILVLDNSASSYLINKGLDLWIKTRNKTFKDNYYAALNKECTLSSYENIYYIKPSKQLKISTLSNSSDLLKETFALGYSDTLENEGLREFLK